MTFHLPSFHLLDISATHTKPDISPTPCKSDISPTHTKPTFHLLYIKVDENFLTFLTIFCLKMPLFHKNRGWASLIISVVGATCLKTLSGAPKMSGFV